LKISGFDRRERAIAVVEMLQKATETMVKPASFYIVDQFGRDPFLILISCLLSLRTKDTVSWPASVRLFEQATTPESLLKISIEQLQKIIYPVAFYRKRAVNLHEVCHFLLENYAGKVPSDLEKLLQIPGVGLKTANLVLAQGFGIPALCVDTHVHRIANRLGLVQTKTPEQTEAALKQVLPPELWIDCSQLLVTWGQNICVPVSPKCSQCVLAPLCPRVGVTKNR
jgi:endonuclease-3